MSKIAITTTSFGKYDQSPLELFKEKGYDVILNPYGRKVTPEELEELAKGAVGIIAGTESISGAVTAKLPLLKVISRCGAGVDNIDIPAMKNSGIKVFNTPDAPTVAVAELTVGLILNILRKVNQMDTNLRNNSWQKFMGNLLYAKKIGIVGFGRIGQKVAQLLSGFGVEIAYCDIEDKSSSVKCSKKNFEEILSWADLITLHLSFFKGQGPLIGHREFNLMKKGSWFINVSRGGLVDEGALFSTLKDRHLEGAALDVFEKEPYLGPLKDLPNVILTPHIGSYAREARIKMEIQATQNLLTALENKQV